MLRLTQFGKAAGVLNPGIIARNSILLNSGVQNPGYPAKFDGLIFYEKAL